jgi:hypothetical protein
VQNKLKLPAANPLTGLEKRTLRLIVSRKKWMSAQQRKRAEVPFNYFTPVFVSTLDQSQKARQPLSHLIIFLLSIS